MDIAPILDALLAGLLAATLVYCVMLEKRLRALRKDQSGLIATLGSLNTAIGGAQACLASLRKATSDVGRDLSRQIEPARALVDELSLLTASGERIAERIAHGRAADPRAARTAGFGDGLRAVR